MNKTNKLWLILGISIFVAFFILGWFGRELYRKGTTNTGASHLDHWRNSHD